MLSNGKSMGFAQSQTEKLFLWIEARKGVISNITVVNNEAIEIDEGEYYLLLALFNGSTDTTPCNEADNNNNNNNNNNNEFTVAFPRGGSSYTVSRSNWNLEVLIFVEGGKPEYPEKNPRSRVENQQ